jgi:4'-phosphopantetheinyl transferase
MKQRGSTTPFIGQSDLLRTLLLNSCLDVSKSNPASPFAFAWALRCGDRFGISGLPPRVLTSTAEVASTPLRPDEIWIWVGKASGDATEQVSRLSPLLSAEINARIKRLRRPQDRASVAIAHAGLRLILGRHLGRQAETLRFGLGQHGKPFILHTSPAGLPLEVHFNISHTDGAVAVALAGSPVGIDIERLRELPDLIELAQHFFAAEIVDEIVCCAPASKQLALFYHHWTLGEALIKATGKGLSQDTKSFAFTTTGAPQLRWGNSELGQSNHWQFGVGSAGI